MSGQWPPDQNPPGFGHPGQTPPPPSNDPSCWWQSEHVQCVFYVVIDTGIGAIFFERKNTHKEQHMIRE